ncbi:helix-turn-helix domain-containing protein [Streptomyces sp. 7N604]|uniref:helix-turn-helix domain-containing protein n=1 Tax=Streptomyces sp. 7N604 TaxID=3457415 RepID=UPI003FD191BF
MLPALAHHKAVGLVLTASTRDLPVYPATTRDLASRLRVPLLTTTAPPSLWKDINTALQQFRLQCAQRRAEHLDGLLNQLPAQLADTNAIQRLAEWIATALDAQVLVSAPERGVLAAVPDSAPTQLAHAVIRQAMDSKRAASADNAAAHTRLISLASATGMAAVLAVASPSPFDTAAASLTQHAAKVMGLLDQAQLEYERAAQSAREARVATFQLLMIGEVTKARRVLAPSAQGLLDTDEVRVYVIDCGTASQREQTARRCETVAAGRALAIRCPGMEQHVIVLEPVHDEEPNTVGLAVELEKVVVGFTDLRMGGSGCHPLALTSDAYEEAITALAFTTHLQEPVALSPGRAKLIYLLEPTAANAWAEHLLKPIQSLPRPQRDQIETALPVALSFPRAAAAAILDVHRNTVAHLVNRAERLLALDLSLDLNKVVVCLALDIAAQPSSPEDSDHSTSGVPDLSALLKAPEPTAWAKALLKPLHGERRDLIGTATAWLENHTTVERTARALNVSEVTVRSHLRSVERATGLDLAALPGKRDLALALHICTDRPVLTLPRPAAA